LVQALLA